MTNTATTWQTKLHAAIKREQDEDHLSSHSERDEQGRPMHEGALTKAAVLIALIERQNGPQIILTRRSEKLNKHSGQIAFPGGRIDAGDKTPTAAAIRETSEEIGVPGAQITILGKLPLYQTGTGFIISPIVGKLTPPYIFKREPNEVDEIFELPLDYIVDKNNFKRQSIIYQGRNREFWTIPYGEYHIWGATAAILVELAERLNSTA